MTTTSTLVILYCVATAVAIAVRRLRVPYTVALVIVGLAIGSLKLIAPPHLTKELLFTFFLPGLLFEAAFHLDLVAFGRVWRSAVALAVPGVVLVIAITAAVIVVAGRLFGISAISGWQLGLVLGAIVAATDPVAVTAVFREVRVPARLAALLEGESLLNDGTGVVFFSLVVAYATGSESSVLGFGAKFLAVAGGGTLVGFCVGWIIALLIQRLNEPMIEIALTMIAAYGSFVLAQSAGVSGVLATVVAGVLCGRHGRDRGMSEASRAATVSFWQYIAFALNSIVFLLIGFEVNGKELLAVWPEIMTAFIAMLIARAVVVWALLGVQHRSRDVIPGKRSIVLAWGGLRGALCMVLALTVPVEMAQRDLLIAMTIGVVVLSIVLQGSTMPMLVRRLGLSERGEDPFATR